MTRWTVKALLGPVLLILIGFFTANVSAGAVSKKYAAFVVDANTGEVLHAEEAQQLRYPASLTKMMTLYIVFELIENRRLTYDTAISASVEAARSPPSKIGLQPGERITVRQAVKALVAKSANDVATAIGEHIAGSEAAFAQLMTRKAHALGMQQTVFRNASGLPHDDQVTTARDMALLAIRLRDHFPNHYYQFKTRTFYYKGHRFKNHNALLGRFRGVDGIKTGYTRASGFHLVASVRDGSRNIVAVVMGGHTARARDAAMLGLLSKYVNAGATVVTRAPDARPNVRPDVHVALPRPPARDGASPSVPSVARPTLLQPNVAQLGPPRPQVAQRQARHRQAQLPTGNSTGHSAHPNAAHGVAPKPAGSDVAIQVGAFKTSREAHRQLENVSARAGFLLDGARPVTVRTMLGLHEIYRARFAGYNSAQAASKCQKLKELGIDCFVARSQ